MKYPKAGDLQAQMGVKLRSNPRGTIYIDKIVNGKSVGFAAGPFTCVADAVKKQLELEHNERRSEVEYRFYEEEPRKNPTEIFAEDADAAVEKFTEFHRFDPKRLEEIDGLEIPARVRKLGAARYVLYRSAKVDPSTLKRPRKPVDYIHEHDAGVIVYATDGAADTDVPKAFREVTALVRLGKCLGFALRDGMEAKGQAPLPDLACTPDGKCILVIQDKREVLAMFWGGALGVFARGIDG